MPYAALFVPYMPVQAVLRAEPSLVGQAVAVLAGEPPQSRVFALNDGARAAGVTLGMTQVQAENADGVVLRRRSITAECSAHEALLDCARIFSPRVEDTVFRLSALQESWQQAKPLKKRARKVAPIESDDTTKRHHRIQPKAATDHAEANSLLTEQERQPCGDLIILDISGLAKLFGDSQAIAESITARAAQFALAIHVGIAANPQAAALAAKGFEGICILPHGKEADMLGSLPVEALEPPQSILETLDRWGVRTCRALAALPEVSLIERLGQEGKRLQQLARGTAERLLVPSEASTSFTESCELEDALDNLEPLAFMLSGMMDRLCTRLSARALSAISLDVLLELADTDPAASDPEINVLPEKEQQSRYTHRLKDGTLIFARTLSLPVPMSDSKLLFRLLHLDLQTSPPRSAVRGITLTATPSYPRAAQACLFTSAATEPARLELMLAKIRKIVWANETDERVGCAELLDSHKHDAFHMKPFRADVKSAVDAPYRTPHTAARIFRPPLAAQINTQDGRPRHITSDAITSKIRNANGPWRLSGDWWHPQESWQCEQWDIAVGKKRKQPRPQLCIANMQDEWRLLVAYD